MDSPGTRRTVSRSAIAIGALVALAHIVAAVGFGMAARRWVSGAAIGAVLVVIALAHLAFPGHGLRSGGRLKGSDLGYLALAVVLGLPVGALMGVIFSVVRWGILLVVVMLAVVLVGRFPGGAAAKALRLLSFGIAAGVGFLATDAGRGAGAGESLSDRVQFVASFGVFAVLAGMVVHLVVNRHRSESSAPG